jgi:adenylosuccinate synthase
VEKETGARIGMVSTGPDREQTMIVHEFAEELKAAANQMRRARAKT